MYLNLKTFGQLEFKDFTLILTFKISQELKKQERFYAFFIEFALEGYV